jgi:hypothetical protein
MTNADYINLFAALCGGISALCWMLSAQVNIRTGYDMDLELAEDLKKAAKLNGLGAAFASVAALCAALNVAAKVVPWLSWLTR